MSLLAAGVDEHPQHFTFIYHCSTSSDADALAASLRNHSPAVSVAGRRTGYGPGSWQVRGTTHRRIQSLGSLEHLFTALRRVASRHDARLTGLMVAAARAA
jgi:hypothetical protein